MKLMFPHPYPRWVRCVLSVSPLYMVVVQLLSHLRLFVTPWTAAHQASLSFTVSPRLLKLVSIESVMPSNHLVLCCPLFLLPSIFPSIRVFFQSMGPQRVRCDLATEHTRRHSRKNVY